jgi:hypothetical protein
MPEFSGQVSDWARKVEARLTAVFREAAQTVFNEVRIPVGSGGNMPVKTGNLRRSATASTNHMPPLSDAKLRYDADPASQVSLTIGRAIIGETIWIGFQANYAPYMENRYGFVRLTAQRWPQIVKEAAEKIERRVQGP